jgi:hypothetical protein
MLAAAVAVWRAVSEDYAPFDVDVTTIPPGSNIDPNFVARACIGGNGAWWGQGENMTEPAQCSSMFT